jgi:uncharacterized protein (TIGR00255 family)
MTGYASAQRSAAPAGTGAEAKAPAANRLGLEIRSVNSRFLDLTFRLPDELRPFEPALRELLTAKLKRGKVEVRAALESASAGQLPEPSARLLQRLSSLQDNVRTWLPDARALSVADILRLTVPDEPVTTDLGEDLSALAKTAVKELMTSREREGARLAGMIKGHVTQLRTLAQQAGPLVPQLVEQQRARFLERWKDAMSLADGATLPEAAQDRALSEATAFAIRIDVAEHGHPGNLFVVCRPQRRRQVQPGQGAAGTGLAAGGVGVAHHARAARPGTARPRVLVRRPSRNSAMVLRDEFFEWAEVHGNLYGTSARPSKRRMQGATWCWRSTSRARCRSSGCSPTPC